MESMVERIAVAVMLVLSTEACGKECEEIQIISALSVSLKDVRNDEVLCNGSVTAQRLGENKTIPLQSQQEYPVCVYRGVGDQPGVYTVNASAPGYKTRVLPNIELEEGDNCRVVGKSLLIRLEPEP
jgi:hypothetical protein